MRVSISGSLARLASCRFRPAPDAAAVAKASRTVRRTAGHAVNVTPMLMRTFAASVAVLLGLMTIGGPASAQTAPAPAAVPAASKPMNYYIVQGPHIVSPAYVDAATCMKALAKIQRDIAPGNDTLACAHRRP
jgi:hypothetical protein